MNIALTSERFFKSVHQCFFSYHLRSSVLLGIRDGLVSVARALRWTKCQVVNLLIYCFVYLCFFSLCPKCLYMFFLQSIQPLHHLLQLQAGQKPLNRKSFSVYCLSISSLVYVDASLTGKQWCHYDKQFAPTHWLCSIVDRY